MGWEKRRSLYRWLPQRITLYKRWYKIVSLDTITFLDTHVCINNPKWKSSGIIVILCKYYIVISDTLIGSWMCFSYWSLYHQSFMRIQEEKIKLQKKVYRRICVRNIAFWMHALLLISFFDAFFVYSFPFVYSDFT